MSHKSSLEPFPFTVEKHHDIQIVIDERVKSLTDNHVRCRMLLVPFCSLNTALVQQCH
jgi:hypothetical protein